MDLDKLLTEKLGVSLNQEDAGTIADLNDIPLHILETLKHFTEPYEIESLLEFYTTPDNERYLRAFTHTVLLTGNNPHKWRKGRVLVPSVSLSDQMTKSLTEIYGSGLDKFDLISKPDYSIWAQGIGTVGCFAIEESTATYKSEKVPGFTSLGYPQELVKVTPESQSIWHHRWIANRMARYFLAKEALMSFQDASLLVELVPEDNWTTDAKTSFNGLLQERALNQWSETSIPGYLGDDSLYGQISI